MFIFTREGCFDNQISFGTENEIIIQGKYEGCSNCDTSENVCQSNSETTSNHCHVYDDGPTTLRNKLCKFYLLKKFFPETSIGRLLSLYIQAMFFSTSIFESAGLEGLASQQATLGMGVVNVLMTFVRYFTKKPKHAIQKESKEKCFYSLVLVEKAGRKTLMLVGLCIMLISTIMLCICLSAAVLRSIIVSLT